MTQAKRRASAASGGEEKMTRRVVIERRRVIVLPEDANLAGELVAAVERLLAEAGLNALPEEDAWVERGEFPGVKMEQAIEAFAGKPGTPEAKIGTWKAIPTTNWKGGVRHSAPPLPLVQRERLS